MAKKATWSGTAFYDQAIADYNKKAKSDYNRQVKQINQEQAGGLKEAYIARMQNQQALQNNLANAGIRGGATETAQLNMMNAYQNQRNTVNQQAQQQRQDAYATYQDNVFNNTQQMRTAQAQYLENMRNQFYQAKYNKRYNIKQLKKELDKVNSYEEKMAINQRIAYLREHKKKY